MSELKVANIPLLVLKVEDANHGEICLHMRKYILCPPELRMKCLEDVIPSFPAVVRVRVSLRERG